MFKSAEALQIKGLASASTPIESSSNAQHIVDDNSAEEGDQETRV